MIVIYHNPDCGTSRNVLRVIEAAGYQPTVIEYLEKGWSKPQLLGLFAAADITPHTALRKTKSPADELGLLTAEVNEEEIFTAMLKYPILVNRPIVCTPRGVKLCRPSETVLEILDQWPSEAFEKEDGELILNAKGKRVK